MARKVIGIAKDEPNSIVGGATPIARVPLETRGDPNPGEKKSATGKKN